MDIKDAIISRHSVRSYLDKPVCQDTVRAILELAGHAPSGANTQPWQVAVVSGATKRKITEQIMEARAQGLKEQPDYQYYPLNWFEPYKQRRFDCGMALYDALDIPREDKENRIKQWNRNYDFFGAPVGLFFLIHKDLDKGSWVDSGMFIQTVMLAARQYGLGTCPQASLADYPQIIRNLLNIKSDYHVICGMSLGYPEEDHKVNQYRVPRADVDVYTDWFME